MSEWYVLADHPEGGFMVWCVRHNERAAHDERAQRRQAEPHRVWRVFCESDYQAVDGRGEIRPWTD